ncbi:MAG: dihydrofolate reductase family protein [Bacteroidia bacterium]|jgi:dihydrofolate reductase|nr:dihydrofolate reductase family protein [Bacteroidia bacterium]
MRTISSFTFISLNGCYKRLGNDINWHQHGEEEAAFSAENLKTGNTLLFGRVTYEMMAGFWPTPMAAELFPEVAQGMNNAEKIVCSSTLGQAAWSNTTIISQDIVSAIRALKKTSGKNITILGSGILQTSLADEGLIDEFQVMIDPVIIDNGVQFLSAITRTGTLKLKSNRTFQSGTVLLTYTK